jgi:DNA (cytosine-5)-methyltransferase 1
MRVGSLFSGVGGFDLGLERAGHDIAFQVENDPFCQRVLAARWPGVDRLDDVRSVYRINERHLRRQCRADSASATANGHEQPTAFHCDLLVGGFPCQDLSVAGKRAGLSGARSSLFHEYVRIAKALTPTWGLVENVPGLLSSHRGRDFWLVLSGLRECWPHVGWRILDSQHFGVPQRRRRVFLVGGPTADGVAQVLALGAGGGGDSAAGGQAGTDVAYALAAGAGGSKFGSGRDGQDTFVTAATLNCDGNNGGFRTEPGEHLVHALTGEGHDASEDGTGRGTPLVMGVSENQRAELRLTDIARQITSGGGKPGQGYPAAMVGPLIRRLTPLECERLQGFPDGWTCLCQPLAAYAADPDAAALACRCPDSPRYRAMGNAVTVNVIEWIGWRFP